MDHTTYNSNVESGGMTPGKPLLSTIVINRPGLHVMQGNGFGGTLIPAWLTLFHRHNHCPIRISIWHCSIVASPSMPDCQTSIKPLNLKSSY